MVKKCSLLILLLCLGLNATAGKKEFEKEEHPSNKGKSIEKPKYEEPKSKEAQEVLKKINALREAMKVKQEIHGDIQQSAKLIDYRLEHTIDGALKEFRKEQKILEEAEKQEEKALDERLNALCTPYEGSLEPSIIKLRIQLLNKALDEQEDTQKAREKREKEFSEITNKVLTEDQKTRDKLSASQNEAKEIRLNEEKELEELELIYRTLQRSLDDQ